jgi:hypothetical protein
MKRSPCPTLQSTDRSIRLAKFPNIYEVAPVAFAKLAAKDTNGAAGPVENATTAGSRIKQYLK